MATIIGSDLDHIELAALAVASKYERGALPPGKTAIGISGLTVRVSGTLTIASDSQYSGPAPMRILLARALSAIDPRVELDVTQQVTGAGALVTATEFELARADSLIRACQPRLVRRGAVGGIFEVERIQ